MISLNSGMQKLKLNKINLLDKGPDRQKCWGPKKDLKMVLNDFCKFFDMPLFKSCSLIPPTLSVGWN